jgi:FecR protein
LKNYRSITTSKFALTLLSFALLLLLPGIALAQDADQQDADPPSRVARLNFIQGSVSFQPAGTSDWLDANPNRPLTTGDQLWADQDSRGELHLGGSVLRISGQTAVSFLNLNDQAVQIQVAQGSADLRVLHLEDNENYEIDTPNAAFSILRPGEYRVDVSPDGTSSVVSVDNGDGEVTAGGQAYNVARGQQYTFSGTDQVSYDAEALPEPDDFQQWNIQRDQREDHLASAQYVSRDVIGYEDLDDHGTWRDDPTYGHVWFPNGVAVGWAPYHYGHWAFVAPWGWTWVEDEPWGFAPFHYGRWAIVGGGWGWVPGPMPVAGAVFVRPVYAPALVAFVGGGGFAASIEIGGAAGVGVAWFPLGPRDVWVPSYHVSAVYMTNVNITNTRIVNRTEITNVYNTTVINRTTNVTANRTYQYQSSPGAVTAVSKTAFQNGEPVGKAAVQVNAQEIQHARVVQTAAVTPTPRAVAGPNAPAKPSSRPPTALANRPVVTKMAPSARAIPVGQTKPAPRTAYKSMANAKPATSQPPARTGAAQPTNRPAESSASSPPAAQRNRPAPAPAERPAPANRVEPSARMNEPAVRDNQPAARPNEPAVRENQPPARANEPATRENQPAARPNQPPARETQPAAHITEAQPNRTAPPPNRIQPPAHESQPPARTNETPAEKPAPNRTPPPTHENQPRQTPPAEAKPAPNRPAPEAKKAAPPPKEAKPPAKTKDEKDKDKEPRH